MPPFLFDRIIRELYVNRLSRHILTAWRLLRYSTVLLTTAPLRCCCRVFLHIQDGLLAEEDEKLPLAWHVVGTPQHFHLVKDFIFIVFMRTQEVVVSDPEGQVVVGAVNVIKAVCVTVRCLIGTVQALDHLFERTVFCGNSIVVGKPDDLGDFEGKVIAKLFNEFHGGEWIGAVAVSDELKLFRQLCKPLESHAHSEDAGADTPVVRHLVADDGACCRIHNEPDVGFDAADFDVSFISGEHIPFFVRILVNERLDADSGSLAVVCDLLMGNGDAVEVFQRLRGFAQGEPEVNMEGKA